MGRRLNGQGPNGHGTNGHPLNGHRLNGAPPSPPDDFPEGWFREKREHRPAPGEYQPQGREYSSRKQEYRQPGDEYPVSGRSILGLNPPQGRRPGQRHRVRNGMLIGLGCLVVIVGVGTGLTGGKLPSSPSGSQAALGTGGAAASTATRPKAKTSGPSRPPAALTYRVTGTPDAAVTYGPAGKTSTGQGPLHITATLGSALYYSITAQLQGSGSVTCEILIGSTLLSKSVATGGHSLASCGISQDPLSGKWQDADGG